VADRSVNRKATLLLTVAHDLHSNGQSSRETTRIATMLGDALDLPATIDLRWGEILLQADLPDGSSLIRTRQAAPAAVNMSLVAKLTEDCTRVCQQRLTLESAEQLLQAEDQSLSSLFLFFAACIAGACALSFTFGEVSLAAFGLIALSAGAGALVRRGLGHLGLSNTPQVFSAALLAGIIGSVSVHLGLRSGLRLIAICPCMILVPGPHLINGSLDLFALRIPLGASRLLYAGLILLGISAGLLVGLSFGSQLLWAQGPVGHDTFWADAIAAGVAAGCYGVYFSMPVRMVIWPVMAGVVAHAIHWWSITAFHAGVASSAAFACFAAGLFLLPLSRRLRLPFAAVGFASVVSLMPGVFIFRFCSGLVQIQQHAAATPPWLIATTLADAAAAITVVLAIVLGLSLPAHALDHLRPKDTVRQP